jgi:hypothetical protein
VAQCGANWRGANWRWVAQCGANWRGANWRWDVPSVAAPALPTRSPG